MKVLAFAFATLALVGGASSAQSLWRDDGRLANLVANATARRVGDTLTIVIAEQTDVQNTEGTKTERSGSFRAAIANFDIDPDAFDVLPAFEANHTRSFNGQADQAKKNSFVTRVQVSVLDVLPNGNLVVTGRRTIRVDDEVKTIEIHGVVRTLDVTAANTVKSEQVAEAQISYVGDGPLTRTTTKGAVASFFDFLFWLVWPF